VATALDGHKSEYKHENNNTVLNMVSRIQNRNTGYSDSLFSHNTRADNNRLSSIEGATALKLDESYEVNEEDEANINFENNSNNQQLVNDSMSNKESLEDISSGVSMESAAYMENNIDDTHENIDNNSTLANDIIEEYTPKLFSETQSFQEDVEEVNIQSNEKEAEELFDQEINEEEDFEIPAFLRKQKF
jgi:hypothetical protein